MTTIKHRDVLDDLMQTQWELAKEIHQGTDPLLILESVLDHLISFADVDGVWVWFAGIETGQLQLKVHRGLSAVVADSLKKVPSNSALGAKIMLGEKMTVRWDESWHEQAAPLLAEGWSDVALWPICIDDDVVGAMCCGRRGGGEVSSQSRLVCRIVAAEMGGRISKLRETAGQRHSSRNLTTLFNAFDDYVFIVDTRGRIRFHNSGSINKLGYGELDLDGTAVDRVIPGSTAMIQQGQTRRPSDRQVGSHSVEQGHVISAQGRLVPVEIRLVPGSWDDHRAHYFVCRDITTARVMERERDRLVAAIEQAAESFVITNSSGTIQYVNPAFTKTTGYDKDEVVGANPRILKSDRQDAAFYRQMWDTITQGDTWVGRLVNRHRDGSLFTEEATISPVRDDSGIITHFVAVKRDVTHETDLEERLRQSQKMEAIGTLAGGIAHDFNNILYALLGYTQLALDDVPREHPARRSLEEIECAGRRASDLVAKMLTFGRRAETGFDVLQLQAVVAEAIELARASLPSTIGFEVSLAEDCPPVLADATQIHQVLLNLCANAEHAMRAEGGTLSVSLSAEELTDKATGSPESPSGPWVRLQVSDTGPGMDESIIERIFEPYFTTKTSNEGTGLGLATVHGIVVDHGGRIRVDSTPGQGATFTIWLPQSARAEAPVAPVERSGLEGEHRGCGKVAIVDDEEMIVDVVSRALSRLGYTVTGFSNGIKALEMFRADPSAFDVVVTDQTMPDITGFELAAQLQSIRSDLPIILTTGYTHLANQDEIAAAGISQFLPKPLRIGELAEAVHRLTKIPMKS